MNAVMTWLAPVERAVIRWTGLSEVAAKVTIIIMLWLTPNIWAAIIVVNAVQSWAQAQDAKIATAASVARWSVSRGIVCDIAQRLNVREQACAGR